MPPLGHLLTLEQFLYVAEVLPPPKYVGVVLEHFDASNLASQMQDLIRGTMPPTLSDERIDVCFEKISKAQLAELYKLTLATLDDDETVKKISRSSYSKLGNTSYLSHNL